MGDSFQSDGLEYDGFMDDTLFGLESILGDPGNDFAAILQGDTSEFTSTLSNPSTYSSQSNTSNNTSPPTESKASQSQNSSSTNTSNSRHALPPQNLPNPMSSTTKLQKNDLERIATAPSIAPRREARFVPSHPPSQPQSFPNNTSQPMAYQQTSPNFSTMRSDATGGNSSTPSSNVPQSYRYQDRNIRYPPFQSQGGMYTNNSGTTPNLQERKLTQHQSFPGAANAPSYPTNPTGKPPGYSRETIKRQTTVGSSVAAMGPRPGTNRYEPYNSPSRMGYPPPSAPLRVSGSSTDYSQSQSPQTSLRTSGYNYPSQGVQSGSTTNKSYNPYPQNKIIQGAPQGHPPTSGQHRSPYPTLRTSQNQSSGFFSAENYNDMRKAPSVANPNGQSNGTSNVWSYIHNEFEHGPHATNVTSGANSRQHPFSGVHVVSDNNSSPTMSPMNTSTRPYPQHSYPDYFRIQHEEFPQSLQTDYSKSQQRMLDQVSSYRGGYNTQNAPAYISSNYNPQFQSHAQFQSQVHAQSRPNSLGQRQPQAQPPSYPPSSASNMPFSGSYPGNSGTNQPKQGQRPYSHYPGAPQDYTNNEKGKQHPS